MGLLGVDRLPELLAALTKATLIFLSITADLGTESHCAAHICQLTLSLSNGWRRSKTHDRSQIGKLLVACNFYGLNEELVAALGVRGRLMLHRLEDHYIEVVSVKKTVTVSEDKYIPATSTSLPGSTRPELGRTQYLSTRMVSIQALK